MVSCQAYLSSGERKGEIELPDTLFGIEPNQNAIYETISNYLANQRRGTASTKSRGQVRGGGRKPWRQKGTGRARVGSIRSPIWVGGGVTFGPKPRDYSYSVNKKVKRLALKSALSLRAKEGKVLIVELPPLDVPKTKSMVEVLTNVGVRGKSCLLVLEDWDHAVYKSGRNVADLTVRPARSVNAYDVLSSEFLLLSEGSLDKLVQIFSK